MLYGYLIGFRSTPFWKDLKKFKNNKATLLQVAVLTNPPKKKIMKNSCST